MSTSVVRQSLGRLGEGSNAGCSHGRGAHQALKSLGKAVFITFIALGTHAGKTSGGSATKDAQTDGIRSLLPPGLYSKVVPADGVEQAGTYSRQFRDGDATPPPSLVSDEGPEYQGYDIVFEPDFQSGTLYLAKSDRSGNRQAQNKDEQATAKERISYADAVKRSGQVLGQLIDDILDLSKIDMGKLDVERVPTALGRVDGRRAHSV